MLTYHHLFVALFFFLLRQVFQYGHLNLLLTIYEKCSMEEAVRETVEIKRTKIWEVSP